MNYYLIDIEHPDNKIRHYRNSRSADFVVSQLNRAAGYVRYRIINDDTPIRTLSGYKHGYEVDHLAPAGQVTGRLS